MINKNKYESVELISGVQVIRQRWILFRVC